MRKLEQNFTVHYTYPVFFGRNVFSPHNRLLASVLLNEGISPPRILCVIDSGVLAQRPFLRREIECYAEVCAIKFCEPFLVLPGGERCKTSPAVIETLIENIRQHHLCRQSFMLVIGGGAVLDAAGYAAAIAHRGLRLIRMPTTVLAQNDAGIGVKNGINAMGRKNFLGTFAPPFAVINDIAFLDTLPGRELRAGMAEAVKVALIKDRPFFDYLYEQRRLLASFDRPPLTELIYRCASLHMHHIGSAGDPFETGSARPLDFGHWSAHKLEEMTGGMLNHGEAVAIGIALDSLYSSHCGMMTEKELRLILTLLTDLGLPIYHPALEELDVDTALDEFRQHLGGELTITLLTGIGCKKEVHRIDTSLMRRCIRDLGLRAGKTGINTGQNALPANLWGEQHQ